MQRTGGAHAAVGRARVLETARQLFVRHGAANVGINEVIAAAGIARMTLYNNFVSKEALIAAVYEEMSAETLADLARAVNPDLPERDRVLGVFDFFDRSAVDADFRGCPFIHASQQAAEASGAVHEIVRAYKAQLRDHIAGVLDADRPDRGELADQILLLLDGAVTEAHLKGVADPIGKAKRAATVLLRATT